MGHISASQLCSTENAPCEALVLRVCSLHAKHSKPFSVAGSRGWANAGICERETEGFYVGWRGGGRTVASCLQLSEAQAYEIQERQLKILWTHLINSWTQRVLIIERKKLKQVNDQFGLENNSGWVVI